MKRLILPLLVLCIGILLVVGYIIKSGQFKTKVPSGVSVAQKEDHNLQSRVNLLREHESTQGVYIKLVSQSDSPDESSTLLVTLQAPEYTAFDAIDIQMSFIGNEVPPSCQTGVAVPLYPRFIVTKDKLILTGTANIADKNILFGSSNSTLVRCKFIKAGDISAVLNGENTHIYSLGTDIFDRQSSTMQINL